jgi:hypothetical protein
MQINSTKLLADGSYKSKILFNCEDGEFTTDSFANTDIPDDEIERSEFVKDKIRIRHDRFLTEKAEGNLLKLVETLIQITEI